MRSKERVLAAFSHQEPDRVPINYFDNPDIHSRMLHHFHLDSHDDEELLRRLNVDFRGVDVPYVGPPLFQSISGIEVNPVWGFRQKWVPHEGGGYLDFCDFPLKDAEIDEIESWPMPTADDFDFSDLLARCEAHSAYAVFWGNTGLFDIINMNGVFRTMEQTLIDLALDEPAALRLIDRRLDLSFELAYRALEKAKGRIDFIWMGEDLGTQIGPMVGPDIYRRIIKPRHQRLVELAKAFGIPVMIHCCGSSSWAFDDFIEIGIQVVDTLQPEAREMEPRYLKNRYGARLAFHGCISTAGPLTFGTVSDVENVVRDTLDIMMPGGGYCLAPTHWIQNNTPVENILVMYDTAMQYGRYR